MSLPTRIPVQDSGHVDTDGNKIFDVELPVGWLHINDDGSRWKWNGAAFEQVCEHMNSDLLEENDN